MDDERIKAVRYAHGETAWVVGYTGITAITGPHCRENGYFYDVWEGEHRRANLNSRLMEEVEYFPPDEKETGDG